MKIYLAYQTTNKEYSFLTDREAVELMLRGLEEAMGEKLAEKDFEELARLSCEWQELTELLKGDNGEKHTDGSE